MSQFDYESMIDTALLGVVKDTLSQVAQNGLSGDNHFYITFLTQFPGVELPERLRDDHPEEITVVLQHQFWNLAIGSDFFSVELSLNGRREKVHVPYRSIVSFSDPSVNFDLDFNPEMTNFAQLAGVEDTDGIPEEAPRDELKKEEKGKIISLDHFRKK